MPEHKQELRVLRVVTALGPDALLLISFSGAEAINQLFNFQLELLAGNETPVPFEKVLGQKVTVELGYPDEEVRYFSGIASRVSQGERDETFTSFWIEVVPQLWFLTRIAQSRIFQQIPVPEILAQVLTGLDVEFQLRGRYEPRDYCVQYRETDFDFASRLMEEEGIFYFFRHTARGHTLVVADSPQSFPELPDPLIYDNVKGGNRPEDRVYDWLKVQELRSGKVTLWDHCFELPHKHLEADKTIQETIAVGTVTHKLKTGGADKLELYDYPGGYAQRFDGVNPGGGDRPADLQKIFTENKRVAEIRMQEEAAAALVIKGASKIRSLSAGTKFALKRHFDADGAYLLTGVQHSCKLGDIQSGNDAYDYENWFTCVPAALPFRPARVTERPFVQGTQTAVVVGPPGEEIFTDKYSRVKVQFHWDRQGKNDANSSCWVRVATPWAGKCWGTIQIPRIGWEVVVDFEEGDPDRPIIIGSVYNADMMPPYGLPANKTQSGMKSRSSLAGGPGNCNELRFEDKKGAEQVYLHAEKNQDIEVENDETHWVGHDRTKTIDNDEVTHVKRHRTETVDKNETITINGNRSETVAKDETITIGKKREENVGDSESITIGGSKTESIGKSLSLVVADEISIKCGGASIVMKKNGDITIEGKNITVSGAGKTVIRGSKVAIN